MTLAGRKIVERAALAGALAALERPCVFTNGCFDILHRGHVDYLEQARALGATLVVGINTDASVARLNKGPGRPVNPLEDRMGVLAALASVSLVVAFDEDTPLALIRAVRPNFLVKGGDWAVTQMVGADDVRSWGGQVATVPVRFTRSTSALIERIRHLG